MSQVIFDSLEQARTRRSAKWSGYDADVLPLPVAEMDVQLAPPVRAALDAALDRGDLGYAPFDGRLQPVFAAFAQRRWGWTVDAAQVWPVTDVGLGVEIAFTRLLAPGAKVVITTPVYPTFFKWARLHGIELVEVPLLAREDGWALDLPALDAALAQADAFLLCHPHNPLGHLHTREELVQVADLAERHDALVISDEIHAPLTMPGEQFVPFLTVSDAARRVGVALHAASKAFNIAGLKCALVVTDSPQMHERVAPVVADYAWSAGILGIFAAEAAYAEGDAWLDDVNADIDANHRLLVELVAEQLPKARIIRSRSTFLAWIDLTGYELAEEPAELLLREGRVALGIGSAFGAPGAGCVRFNVGCHPDLVREGVRRMAAVLEG